MQSIFGALLTAGYAAAAGAAIAASGDKTITSSVESELTKSFSSAADTAARYPASVQQAIIEGAKSSFLKGDQWAYTAGIIAVVLGAAVVFLKFPKAEQEKRLLAEYTAQDAAADSRASGPGSQDTTAGEQPDGSRAPAGTGSDQRPSAPPGQPPDVAAKHPGPTPGGPIEQT
jgi:hypothetical protein